MLHLLIFVCHVLLIRRLTGTISRLLLCIQVISVVSRVVGGGGCASHTLRKRTDVGNTELTREKMSEMWSEMKMAQG